MPGRPGGSRPNQSPATPPRGSSPITPPSGSAPRLPGRRNAPRPPASTNPLVQVYLDMQRRRAVNNVRPNVPAPRMAAPTRPAIPFGGAPTNIHGRRLDPARMTRAANVPTPPSGAPLSVYEGGAPEGLDALRAAAVAPSTTSQANSAFVKREIAYPIANRLSELQTRINEPTWVEHPAPVPDEVQGMIGAGLFARNNPRVTGIRENADGSTDWVVGGGTNPVDYAPKGRFEEPSVWRKAGRAITGALGIGLEVTGLPAKAVERGLGTALGSQIRVNQPVLLPNGQTYTPPNTQQPRGPIGRGGRPTPPGVTRNTTTNPSVADAARSLWPDNPNLDTYLRDVTRIAYSTPEAQLRAVARMVEFGELPDTALYGDGGYVGRVLFDLGYADDPWKAIQADPLAKYAADVWLSEGKTQDWIVDKFNTAGLPGEEDLFREVAVQSILDPLNFVGGFADDAVRARRVAAAQKWFEPSLRTLDEVVGGLIRKFEPYANDTANLLAPWAHTPSAVRAEVVERGGDAAGMLLTGLRELPEGQRPRLLRAWLDLAAPAPERLADQTDEAFEIARRTWQATQDNAREALRAFPFADSDAGKLGAALTRNLLTNANGQIDTRAIRALVENDKPVYEVIAALGDKLNDAATDLLRPGRAGARTPAQFAEFTGQAASEFPVFERGLQGATERVKLAQKGQGFQANAADWLLHGFDTLRAGVNGTLWHLFASLSPAYAARNAANNFTTAVVDGVMDFTPGKQIDELLALVGDPAAARRGIGSSAAITGEKARDLLATGASNKIEAAFSKRIVYNQAKAFLDRVMVYGQAIPELPPTLLRELGDETALVVAQRVALGYGDVDGALAWLKQQGGTVDLGRQLGADHFRALQEFDPDTARRVSDLLTGSQSLDEFRQGLATLRREVAEKLDAVDAALPNVAAMNSERAAEYAEDTRQALDAGLSENVPGVRPDEFERRLAEDQLRTDTARGVAQGARNAQFSQGPDAFRAAVTAFDEVDTQVGTLARQTRTAHTNLRKATWERTSAIRNMNIKPNAKAGMLNDLWADYFKQRDELWLNFRKQAIDLWNGYAERHGTALTQAALPVQQAATQAAQAVETAAPAAGGGRRVNRDDLFKGTRDLLPPDVSEAFRADAQALLDELNSGEPGARLGVGYGADQQTISVGSTYPNWYSELVAEHKTNIQTVRNQLQKIIDGNGKDTGVTSERLKQIIWDRLQNGNPLDGTPPEPEVLRFIGKIEEADQAAARWAESGMEPMIRPGGLEYAPELAPDIARASDPVMPVATGGPEMRLEMQGAPPVPDKPRIPSQWTPDDPRSILSTLNSLEVAAVGKWGQTRPANLSDEGARLLEAWADGARAQTRQARVIAGQVGAQARDFALLNYPDRRNLDGALSLIFPYHYWYGRTYKNWALRFAKNPAALAHYGRYRQSLEKMHAALPEYWRQQLSTDDLGIPLDNPLAFNLEQTLSPLYGLLGSDFTDENRRRAALLGQEGAGALVEEASSFGPTVWAPIVWGMAFNSYLRGDDAAGNAWLNNYLGSPSRALRAGTALAGIGGPGGVNLDPQMMLANAVNGNGIGTNSMTPWERNRVAQVLTGMLESPPAGTDPETWKAQLMDQAYAQRGPQWDEAMTQMFRGTAPSVLVSYAFGLGFRARSETEQEFGQIWAELANIRARKAGMTAEEVQQAYLDLERRHPMYDLLMLSRADGPDRNDAWVWEAMNRVGPANRGAWEAAGVSDAALDAFFAAKGTEGIDPLLLRELLDGATAINAVYAPRTIEESQRQLEAKAEYNAIADGLRASHPAEAFDLEQEYFAQRDTGGPEAAKAWLDNLPDGRRALLLGLWDDKTDQLTGADELTQRYYLKIERKEQQIVDAHYTEMEQAYPGMRDLNKDYWALRDTGDYDAARLLLEENPQLKEYWDANSVFWDSEKDAALREWLNGLPDIERGAFRADADAAGLRENTLYQYTQAQAAEYAGAGLATEADQQPAQGGATSRAEEYRLKAEQAKLDAEDAKGYLSTTNTNAYGEAVLRPLMDELAAQGITAAADFMDTPLSPNWPSANAGTAGLLALIRQTGAESLREALLLYTTQTGNAANWAKYVGLLRSMPDEELERLVKKYPELADAAFVAEQAREYQYPTLTALHDLLGFTVNWREDGTYSISRQSLKRDKKTGLHGPDIETGVGRGGSTRGVGGSTSRAQYDDYLGGAPKKVSTRKSPSRSGGGRRNYDDGGYGVPSDEAERSAAWVSFAAEFKLEDPRMLTLLMEYFDLFGDDYRRQAFLARYPELLKYLQSLAADRLAGLEQGYLLWRDAQDEAQRTAAGDNRRVTPRITRYYARRSGETGL